MKRHQVSDCILTLATIWLSFSIQHVACRSGVGKLEEVAAIKARLVAPIDQSSTLTSITTTTLTSTSLVAAVPSYLAENGQGTLTVATDRSNAVTFRLVDQQLYANGKFYGALSDALSIAQASYVLTGEPTSAAGNIVRQTFAIDASTHLTYIGRELSSVNGFCVASSTEVFLHGVAASSTACSTVVISASLINIAGPVTTTTTLNPTQSAYTSTVIGSNKSQDTVIIGVPASTSSTTTSPPVSTTSTSCSEYRLRVAASGSPYDGTYAYNNDEDINNGASQPQANTYTLETGTNYVSTFGDGEKKYLVAGPSDPTSVNIYSTSTINATGSNLAYLTCRVDAVTRAFTCSVGTKSVFISVGSTSSRLLIQSGRDTNNGPIIEYVAEDAC